MKDKCCGRCKWQKHETIGASVFECDVWVCKNADSRYCEEWVGYDHNGCEEWEER